MIIFNCQSNQINKQKLPLQKYPQFKFLFDHHHTSFQKTDIIWTSRSTEWIPSMELYLHITWFGFPFLLTRIAGSLTNADLFLFGERFCGGIWRVTPKVVCLPISSAKKLASRTKVLAFMMSCRSCARLRLNMSSLPGYKRDVCSSMSSLEYNVKSQ